MTLKSEKIDNLISFINKEESYNFTIHENINKKINIITLIEENSKKGIYYNFLINMPIFLYKYWTQINTNKKEQLLFNAKEINVFLPNIINDNNLLNSIKKNIKKSIKLFNNVNELYNNDILSSIALPQCVYIQFYEYGNYDDYNKIILDFEKKIINTYDKELLKCYIDSIRQFIYL